VPASRTRCRSCSGARPTYTAHRLSPIATEKIGAECSTHRPFDSADVVSDQRLDPLPSHRYENPLGRLLGDRLPQFEGTSSLFFRCIFSGTVDLQSDAVFWQNERNSGPWKPRIQSFDQVNRPWRESSLQRFWRALGMPFDLRTSFDMNLHHMVQAIVTVLAVINPVVCGSIFLTLTPKLAVAQRRRCRRC
jgi:hypothetical protein